MTGILDMFAELDGYDRYQAALEQLGSWARSKEVERAVEWARNHREQKRATNRKHKARLRQRATSDSALAEKLRKQKRDQTRRYRTRHLEHVRRWDREYRRGRRRQARAA